MGPFCRDSTKYFALGTCRLRKSAGEINIVSPFVKAELVSIGCDLERRRPFQLRIIVRGDCKQVVGPDIQDDELLVRNEADPVDAGRQIVPLNFDQGLP